MRDPRPKSAEPRNSVRCSASGGPIQQPRALDFLFASGEILPTQLASHSNWSAEKKLAAAVLEGALAEIRNYGAGPRHVRTLKETLEWVRSEDTSWPFAFRPLCELFSLDVDWVRERVTTWTTEPRREEASRSRYRHAA